MTSPNVVRAVSSSYVSSYAHVIQPLVHFNFLAIGAHGRGAVRSKGRWVRSGKGKSECRGRPALSHMWEETGVG